MSELSAFSDESFKHVVVIYLARIYDLLSVQGNEEAIKKMIELHEQGGIIGPPPSFIPN